MKLTVICDIDGTIAKREETGPGWREPFEWDRVHEDGVHQPIVKLVWMLRDAGYQIVFVSGRMEAAREGTLRWLDTHVFCEADHGKPTLFMRADGDYRKDTVAKQEIYHREIEGIYNVKYVLDDRDSVVAMWRGLGLTVLQVADGKF